MFVRSGSILNSKTDIIIYLLIMVLFAVVACYFQPLLILPAFLILAGIYWFTRSRSISKDVSFSSYMDNVIRNIERTNHYAVRKLDVGIAVFSKAGKLQWANELFAKWTGIKELEGKKPEEVLPLSANAFELLCVKDGEQVVELRGRFYKLKHYAIRMLEREGAEDGNISGLMLYLSDITDYEELKKKSESEKLCLAYFRFDNYEEVTRGLSETSIANISGEVNELLTRWTAGYRGFICRMNRESSLMGFTQWAVDRMMEYDFPILDEVREIRGGNKFAPTMSIGISCDGATLEELARNANNSLNLALGRGGDQAVVLKNKEVKFFGGMSSVNAKSTRVRARIVARTLREEMLSADKIFIMGHYNEDYDAVGSAVGMAKLGFAISKETYIVVSELRDYFDKIADAMKECDVTLTAQAGKYLEIMIGEQEALRYITPNSLLILVDHHRSALSASKIVLEAIKRRVIIDHHRRAEDIIQDTELLYLEPSSSSASELVTELIGYFDEGLDISPSEATALYAGMVLDTKNFAVQTGERTFEAAALLRRAGADPNIVRRLFKDEMSIVKERAKMLAEAEQPFRGFAWTAMRNAPHTTESSVLVAQAADMLVTIEGIAISVAFAEYEDGLLGISARSDGTANVQVIMEALGGGGHQSVSGAQLPGKRVDDVLPEIMEMARKQLDEIKQKQSEECDKNEGNSAAGH